MKINRYLALAIISIICASCAEKLPIGNEGSDSVLFRVAEYSGSAQVITKADTYKTMVEADWYYLRYHSGTGAEAKSSNIPVVFRMHEFYTAPTEGATPEENWGTYKLSKTNAGRLTAEQGSRELNWQTKNGKHTFHSWSEPEGLTMAADNKSGILDMTVSNCDYERFVGVQAADKDYLTNGVTVGLDYRHLISKIQIDKISIIKVDGAVNSSIISNLWTIYFPDLPVLGKFYTGVEDGTDPHVEMLPEGENKTGQLINFMKFPYRIYDGSTTWNYSGQSGANNPFMVSTTYNGTSSLTWTPRPFYTLPFKFADYGRFVIAVTHPADTEGGSTYVKTYEGNLKDLVPSGVSEIKAGEVLVLRLVLNDQKGTGGLGIVLRDWDVRDVAVQQVSAHVGVTQNDFIKNSTYTIKANSAATKQYGVEVKD
ncbi:MAG: hypothetical protein HUJ95_04085, partial [Bacteroidales bacterium]|nr:hypothetical protein [Bacteroidales bacterium]